MADADTTAPTATDEGKQTPPWGTEQDFNPDKAWTLIQNLRTERDQAKATAAQARTQTEELTTQVQALTTELDTTKTTNTDLQASINAETTARAKDRLLTAAGLDPQTYADLVTGDTPQDWDTKIQALTALRTATPQDTSPKPDPAQSAEPATDSRTALAVRVFGD